MCVKLLEDKQNSAEFTHIINPCVFFFCCWFLLNVVEKREISYLRGYFL